MPLALRLFATLALAVLLAGPAAAQGDTSADQLNKLSLENLTAGASTGARPLRYSAAPRPYARRYVPRRTAPGRHFRSRPRAYGRPHIHYAPVRRYGLHRGPPPPIHPYSRHGVPAPRHRR